MNNKRQKKILIINSINDIPSNQQYYHLGLKILDNNNKLIFIKDNSRKIENFEGDLYYWKNKNFLQSVFFFLKILYKYKYFDTVILNFRAANYSFIFYFFTKKTIITIRSDFFPKNFLQKIKSSFKYLFCNHIVCISQYIKNKAEKHLFFTKNKITVFYNSINIDKHTEINQHYVKDSLEKEIKIIFVGNLEKHKGFDSLMHFLSINSFNNLKVSIAGDGSLRNLIPENNPSISFLGKLSHRETMKNIKESHYLISLSTQEAFGQVIIEAFTLDTIPIIIEGTGSSELIIQNQTGFIGKNIEDCFDYILKTNQVNYSKIQENIIKQKLKFDTSYWVNEYYKFIID